MEFTFQPNRVVRWDWPLRIAATSPRLAAELEAAFAATPWGSTLVRVVRDDTPGEVASHEDIALLVVDAMAQPSAGDNMFLGHAVAVVGSAAESAAQAMIERYGASAYVSVASSTDLAEYCVRIVVQLSHANTLRQAVAAIAPVGEYRGGDWVDHLTNIRIASMMLVERLEQQPDRTLSIVTGPTRDDIRAGDLAWRLRQMVSSAVFEHEGGDMSLAVNVNNAARSGGVETGTTVDMRARAAMRPPRSTPSTRPSRPVRPTSGGSARGKPAPVARPTSARPGRSPIAHALDDLDGLGAGADPTSARPSPIPRRLIANAYVGGQRQTKCLSPNTPHDLEVLIAIPQADETASPIAFPESSLPETGAHELTIEVRSKELGLFKTALLLLDRSNRSEASDAVRFSFTTGAEDSVVDIAILVLFKKRPLQEAHFRATVRSVALPRDRVRIYDQPLSVDPTPNPDSSEAEYSYVLDGNDLHVLGSDVALDGLSASAIANAINQIASSALTDRTRLESKKEQTSFLIELARTGRELFEFLDQRDLVKDGSPVSLLTDMKSDVLPLELVYDAPSPTTDATMCVHTKAPARKCEKASEAKVCPYRFWGASRAVSRVIRFTGKWAHRAPIATLDLEPILYSSVARADDDAPPGPLPSQRLAAALRSHVGKQDFAQVASWEQFAKRISREPELIVVLGHTDRVRSDTRLYIGKDDMLASRDLSPRYVGEQGSPPLVLLLACSSAISSNPLGNMAGKFIREGAAAVVGTLTQLTGPHAASAGEALVDALFAGGADRTLGVAVVEARRRLLAKGLLVGLLLVTLGEIDLPFK